MFRRNSIFLVICFSVFALCHVAYGQRNWGANFTYSSTASDGSQVTGSGTCLYYPDSGLIESAGIGFWVTYGTKSAFTGNDLITSQGGSSKGVAADGDAVVELSFGSVLSTVFENAGNWPATGTDIYQTTFNGPFYTGQLGGYLTVVEGPHIITQRLPNAVIGEPYSFNLSGVAGAGQITWGVGGPNYLPSQFKLSGTGTLSSSGAVTAQPGVYYFAALAGNTGSGLTDVLVLALNVVDRATPGKELGDPQERPGGSSVGEPIDVGSGNVYDSVIDYQSAGANRLSLIRYYNSLGNFDANAPDLATTLGFNWRSNYDRYIDIQSSSAVALEREDGQVLTFKKVGSIWISDTDVDLSVTQSGTTWKVQSLRGTIETYSAVSNGNFALLTSIQFRGGYSQALTYNPANHLTSVSDSYGRKLTFTYNLDELIQTVTTPDGEVISYGYDWAGNPSPSNPSYWDRLDTVTYSTTPASTITYLHENSNLPYAVTGVLDEDGNRYISWTYDQYGRGLTSQFGSGSLLTSVEYNDNNGSRVVTLPLGEIDTYHFTTLQGVPKVSEIDRAATATSAAAKQVMTYDPNGYLASKTDWNGNITSYLNDTLGRPTTTTEAASSPSERVTTYSYLANSNLATFVTKPRQQVANTYDSNGNLLTRTVTDKSTQTVPYKTNGQTRTWQYSWANGNLTSVKNPRSDLVAKTEFAYDSTGALVKSTNALGQSVTVTAHTPGGLPLESIDANGVSTNYTYDVRSRLTSKQVGATNTSYQYDPAGNLISTTLPDGSTQIYGYDSAHRRTSITNSLGEKQLFSFDDDNDVIEIETMDAASTLQRKQSFEFDALGRNAAVIDGAGQTTKFVHDENANLTGLLDGTGHLTTHTYDALNRVSNTYEAGGETSFAYNDADEPVSVTAPNGATTLSVYDGFNELIQLQSPDSGATKFSYDADSNTVQRTDGAGHLSRATFDALDRITSETYPASAAENVSYVYDQASHGDGIGRLTSLTDEKGSLQRSYDFRGLTTSETRTAPLGIFSTVYSYDSVGRLAGITYPSGTAVSYSRDTIGRIKQVVETMSGKSETLANGFAYKPFGPVSGLTFGNGVKETRSFDDAYRMTSILDIGTSPILSLDYAYDNADNVLSITNKVFSAQGQRFGYDSLEHLSAAVGSYGTPKYSYDLNGNRLEATGTDTTANYGYLSNSNRLTELALNGASVTVSSDGSGAITNDGVNQYSYDQNGRLSSVAHAGNVIGSYGYDAFGRRLTKTSSLGSKEFTYGTTGDLLEETSDSLMPTTDYVYLDDGRPLAMIAASTGAINYLLTDRLGAPQRAVNSLGRVAWDGVYTPFGAASTLGSLVVNLRFPGQYYDAETGSNYNGFRDYVPLLGRYLESDPIGLGGGLNTYAYVGSNPVKKVDPLGLCESTDLAPPLSPPPLPPGWHWNAEDASDYLSEIGDVVDAARESVDYKGVFGQWLNAFAAGVAFEKGDYASTAGDVAGIAITIALTPVEIAPLAVLGLAWAGNNAVKYIYKQTDSSTWEPWWWNASGPGPQSVKITYQFQN